MLVSFDLVTLLQESCDFEVSGYLVFSEGLIEHLYSFLSIQSIFFLLVDEDDLSLKLYDEIVSVQVQHIQLQCSHISLMTENLLLISI